MTKVKCEPEDKTGKVRGRWYRDKLTLKASKPRFSIDTAIREGL